jgi:hypothetical protein
MRRRLPVAVAAALLGLLVMVVCFGPTDNWSWDPSFYYAQIRSPLIEGDLDFRNETKTGTIELPYTATGLQPSMWPIGPSLLWSPFFLAAHGLTLALSSDATDGFAAPYIALVSLGSLAYGVVGLTMIYRLCRAFGGRSISLAVTMLCLGATPLFFYMFRQPLMAHSTGLSAAAAIVLIYLRLSAQATLNRWSGLLFGVVAVLCFLTRWNGLLMVTVPALYFAEHLRSALRRRASHDAWLVLRQVGVMLGVGLLTLTPQLALFYRLHGNFLIMPQGSDAFVDGLLPLNLPAIFFHTNRGLIFWCPFVLVGMAGLLWIPDRRLRFLAIFITLCQVVLIGYRVDWYSGGGFGARYFIELLPFLAIGIVALLGRLPRGRGLLAAASVCAIALVLHQFVLMHAVEHGSDGWLNTVNYSRGRPLGVRWQLDALLRLLGDPLLWLTPRPYVATDRQTILVNVLAGVRDPRAYMVTGIALALAPVVALVVVALRRRGRRYGAAPLLMATTAYFAAWSAFIMLI